MSVRFKRAAASVLAPLGALRLYGRARRGHSLVLLGYHRVLPIDPAVPHPGDVELISATPEEFAWQLEYLGRHFEPVTFDDIARAMAGEITLPRRAVSISFDDGFQDLHEHAWPALQRAGMPATVFVCTDYVESGAPFWFDLVAYVLMHAPVGSVQLPSNAKRFPVEDTDAARRAATVVVLRWLKRCSESDRQVWLEAFRERFREIAAGAAGTLGRSLNWREIREMAADSVQFGSHTVSHRCLAQLGADDLRYELTVSRQRLESELGTPVTALAYPFGGTTAYNAAVITAARAAGYRVAATYIPGVKELPAADPFELRRQHVERDTTRSYFEALVNVPEVFD